MFIKLTLSLRASLKPEAVLMVVAGLRCIRQTLIASIQQLGDFTTIRLIGAHRCNFLFRNWLLIPDSAFHLAN